LNQLSAPVYTGAKNTILFFKVNGKAAELNNKKRKDIDVRYIEVPEVLNRPVFTYKCRSIDGIYPFLFF
jgi:hypothetical protein